MEIQILLNLSIYYSDGDLTSNKVTVKNKYRGTWEAQLVKHPPLGSQTHTQRQIWGVMDMLFPLM